MFFYLLTGTCGHELTTLRTAEVQAVWSFKPNSESVGRKPRTAAAAGRLDWTVRALEAQVRPRRPLFAPKVREPVPSPQRGRKPDRDAKETARSNPKANAPWLWTAAITIWTIKVAGAS